MRKWFLLLMALLIVGIAPVFAQTSEPNESPLLTLLAHIPDNASAREYLSYIDYRALFAARPGAPQITSWTQFNTLLTANSKESAAVKAALYGVQSGPQFFATSLMQAGDMPSVAGFDVFAIERAVEFGNPPNKGDLLEGDFDAQAVINAHEKRGYTSSAQNGLTLLCPAAGCDSGTQLDMSNINNANPFGGNLGRSQPVLVGDRLVASSPSLDVVNAIADTAAGKSASLADQPDYRAAAEAISAGGTLIQTYFVQPTDIGAASSVLMNSRLSAAQIKALTAQLQANFVPLPAYNLIALADTATATEQQALVALVYTTQANAEAAAALFPKRLQDYTSLVAQKSMSDLLAERGVTSMEASVYAASTDRYVVIVTLHAPLPSNTIPADGTTLQASSLVYSLLVRAYQSRDLGWLATQF